MSSPILQVKILEETATRKVCMTVHMQLPYLDLSQVSMLEKRVDFLTRIVVSDLQVETV